MSKAYRVLASNTSEELGQAVENWMGAGWEPCGGIAIDRFSYPRTGRDGNQSTETEVIFYQAVIHPNHCATMRRIDHNPKGLKANDE